MEVRSLLAAAAALAAIAFVAFALGFPGYGRLVLGGAIALVAVVLTDRMGSAR